MIVPFLSHLTRKKKIPIKLQKNSKKFKIPLWLYYKLKQVGKGREREKIKIIVPFRSYPKHNKNSLKIAKKFKKLKKKKKSTNGSFQAKIGRKRMRNIENKNYRSVSFHSFQTRSRNFKKLKNTIMDSFQAIIGWKRMRERK